MSEYPHDKLPVEYIRRCERAQRAITQLTTERQAHANAVTYSYQLLAANAVGFVAGMWVSYDGFRSAHPLWSPLRRFTKNNAICKLTAPICLAGFFMMGLSVSQTPGEFERRSAAQAAMARIDAEVAAKKNELVITLKEGFESIGLPTPADALPPA